MGIINLDEIESEIEGELQRIGISVYDLEMLRDPVGLILRIYIDREGPVGLDDCSKASQIISKRLDDIGVIETKYFLEVSSPGLERRLRKPNHFAANVGKKAKVKVKEAILGKKTLSILIKSADQEGVLAEIDGEDHRLDYEMIQKANLVADFQGFSPTERSGKK